MYRPKIDERQLKSLYVISKRLDIPVTRVLRIALESFFIKFPEFRENKDYIETAITYKDGKYVLEQWSGVDKAS
jgi:hypothetical protein